MKNTMNSLKFSGGGLVRLIDFIYPIGAIRESTNGNFNPNKLYKTQTWVQIKDKFLLSAGDIYKAGTTGGSATHTLSVDEMPSHNHDFNKGNYVGSGYTNTSLPYLRSSGAIAGGVPPIINVVGNKGGGLAHNNMPPYEVVYVWKRTQ